MSGLKRYRTAVDEGDKEELFDYFKDVVFEDEEAEDWDSEEGKERLSAIVKIVRHVAEMEGRTGQPPRRRRRSWPKSRIPTRPAFSHSATTTLWPTPAPMPRQSGNVGSPRMARNSRRSRSGIGSTG